MPLLTTTMTPSSRFCEFSRIDGCSFDDASGDGHAPMQGASPTWTGSDEKYRLTCGMYDREPYQVRLCAQTIHGKGQDWSFALDLRSPLPAETEVVLLNTKTVLQITLDPSTGGPLVEQYSLEDTDKLLGAMSTRCRRRLEKPGQLEGCAQPQAGVDNDRGVAQTVHEELQVLHLEDELNRFAHLSLRAHTLWMSSERVMVAVGVFGACP